MGAARQGCGSRKKSAEQPIFSAAATLPSGPPFHTSIFLPIILCTFAVIAKMVVWIGENIFWNLLKSFFHITETAKRRNQLLFYRKRDYQSVVDKTFDLLKDKKCIKFIRPELCSRLAQKFGNLAPVTARCRLLPKENLNSLRLIARKEKTCCEVKNQLEDSRLLLEHLAKSGFPHTIDVKGKFLLMNWEQSQKRLGRSWLLLLFGRRLL